MVNKDIYKTACLKIVEDKIKQLEEEVNQSQLAANSDTKSSAGDKHETARAMAQIEAERIGKQLQVNYQLREIVVKLDTNNKPHLSHGSLVKTSVGEFYLSIGLGKVPLEQSFFYAIPLDAPVGKQLLGKTIHDSFMFDGKEALILEIN